jgi:hypothetical protein
MIKKCSLAAILILGMATPVFSATKDEGNATQYCETYCTPSHCQKNLPVVPGCKKYCPDKFKACYAALSKADKKTVDVWLDSPKTIVSVTGAVAL